MRQISRRMEIIHPKIGWRRDEHGTHKHAHGSWILWSVSRVRSKTMHSLSCITSWLPYITLCYIDSRFFLPLEQSRMAILGCRLAASPPRIFVRLLVSNNTAVISQMMKNSPASPCSFLSSCFNSSARSAQLMAGSSKACINRVKALGPLFSSKVSMVCVPVVAPRCEVFASISSKSPVLNIVLRCADKITGFEILFIISEVLFARTFLWIGSMVR